MEEGWEIKVSPMITPDTVFVDEDAGLLVFHPYNYNYIDQPDMFRAHEMNMELIQARIDQMAADALDALDDLVHFFEHQHDPRIVAFLYDTEVTENEDGSFSFFARGAQGEPIVPTVQGDFVQAMGQEQTTYQTLRDDLGREPTFDELVKGY